MENPDRWNGWGTGKRAGNTSRAAVVGSLKGEVSSIGDLAIREGEL